jgi:hypothetical protein
MGFILDGVPPEPKGTSCYDDKLRSNVWATQVFIALHETSHFVAASLGLNGQVLKAMMRNDPVPLKGAMRDGLEANARERLADTAASLYFLSNYRDADTVKAFQDFRQAIPEPTHYTTSSIAAAQTAFVSHPRYGMSIVDAGKWAAQIISSQHGLVHEYLMANKHHEAMLELPVEESAVAKHGRQEKPSFPREAAARDRLCTFSPTRPDSPPF